MWVVIDLVLKVKVMQVFCYQFCYLFNKKQS